MFVGCCAIRGLEQEPAGKAKSFEFHRKRFPFGSFTSRDSRAPAGESTSFVVLIVRRTRAWFARRNHEGSPIAANSKQRTSHWSLVLAHWSFDIV
jgi:hypothetical protein